MSFLPPPMLTQRPHIVAHLDFLGAREKMRSKEQCNVFLQQINEVFTRTDSQLSRITKSIQRSMYARIFSDNILVAIEPQTPNVFFSAFLQIAKFCTMFQLLALSKGLFVRGAIAYGDFIGNDIFVYGEALVNAYEAETTCAIYPRIIIDKTVWGNFPEQRYRTIVRNEFFQELFKFDVDGQWYISPFGITPPSFQLQDKISHLSRARDFLIAEYKNSKKEKYKQKYFWLIQKFNEFCNRNQDYQNLQIPLAECDPKLTEVML